LGFWGFGPGARALLQFGGQAHSSQGLVGRSHQGFTAPTALGRIGQTFGQPQFAGPCFGQRVAAIAPTTPKQRSRVGRVHRERWQTSCP